MKLKDLEDVDMVSQDADPEDPYLKIGNAGSAPAMGDPSTASASPALDADSPPMDAKSLMVSPDDLKQAAETKRNLALMGAVGNNLANRQSFGNYFLGHMNPHQDLSGFTKEMMDQADQPVKQKMALQAQTTKAPEIQYAMDLQNKDSDASKGKQAELQLTVSALAKLGQLDPTKAQAFAQSASSMNGFQAGKLLDSMKPLTDVLKANGMLALTGRRLDQGDTRIAMAKDNQAVGAASKIDQDHLLTQYQQQSGQIGKALGLLNAPGVMTHQTASELATDLGTILNQGRAAGLGQANKQEYASAEGALAAAKQWMSGHPQDALPEEFKQQLRDQFARLRQAVVAQQTARAKQLAVGRSFSHNPDANAKLQEKLQSYQVPEDSSGDGLPVGPNAQASGPASITDDDRQALKWAQANPGDKRAAAILMKLSQKMGGK